MAHPRLRTLVDRSAGAGPDVLPAELRELYDGDLRWADRSAAGGAGSAPGTAGAEATAGAEVAEETIARRPYVIANFVASLDGVVSYKLPQHSGGADISGGDAVDHFIMGLLRASADAVMVGAGTLQDAPAGSLWTAEHIYPPAASIYASYRRALGKAAPPVTVIVSASGLIDLSRPVFQTPGSRVLIVTTQAGSERLSRGGQAPPGAGIAPPGAGTAPAGAGIGKREPPEVLVLEASRGRINPLEILKRLRDAGVRLLLHEGGPTLFGDFLSAGAVDELFLTLAPQVIGRVGQTRRPGLVQGLEFLPEGAPWFSLLSLKCHGEQLYLRYRCTGPREAPQPTLEARDRPTRA